MGVIQLIKEMRVASGHRPYKSYDPPAHLHPLSSHYADYESRRTQRESRAWRWTRIFLVWALTATGLLVALIIADMRATQFFARELAHREVFVLRDRPAGQPELLALDNTVAVDKGARVEAIKRFMEGTRWISSDPILTNHGRDDAIARLSENARDKWKDLISKDPKVKDGWTRDAVAFTFQELTFDPKTRRSSIAVMWKERLFKDNKAQNPWVDMYSVVTTQDVNPRPGAMDGVEVEDFGTPAMAIRTNGVLQQGG